MLRSNDVILRRIVAHPLFRNNGEGFSKNDKSHRNTGSDRFHCAVESGRIRREIASLTKMIADNVSY